MKGKLITFEGCDGCGKTTQSALAIEYLAKKGFCVVKFREPGATKLGEEVRRLLLDPALEKSPEEELLLYETARSRNVKHNILPALGEGKIIICDRFYDSSTAYQAYGGNLDPEFVTMLNMFATGGLKPDLTIILDIDPTAGLAKVTRKEFGKMDWQEQKKIEFHQKVREGYLTIAKEEPDRVKVINYRDGDIDGMQNEIRTYINQLLGID